MMKKLSFLLCLPILLGFCSCRKHLITDSSYRYKVEAQFEKTKELAKNRTAQLFDVFSQDMTIEEKEGLEFLYAYMPLSDLADYNGDYFLKNVRLSLAARDTFSWGKTVPEMEFRHFVLPIRVNNENLDSSRGVFFLELKDRIRHLTMKDAVLEINHWCREQVTYKGTDDRTSSPLSTIKTAYGRCGEESTFTVAALRAACIPARQCYTPRWAHCDDNHAWVEVWVDGKWHYLGACEPEPVLDRAWFTEPAKRAMLVNTNVFGDYEGPEDVLVKDPRFTRINILPNYTKTKRLFVKVRDSQHKPIDSVSVEFQLYNYAEFYPLTKCYTDGNGLCSFLTGYGDLVVWAAKGGMYSYAKADVRVTDTLNLELSMKPGLTSNVSFDLVPPMVIHVQDVLGDSLKKQNTAKVETDDRKRANYEQTFIDSAKSYRLAANLKLNADTLWQFLQKSRGNWRDMISFITAVPESQKASIFSLLSVISEKDLHDISFTVLEDVLANGWKYEPLSKDRKDLVQYILNPRIDNEFLKPWRGYLLEHTDKSLSLSARKDPLKLKEWIAANISVNNEANYGRAPITPIGVFEMKVADPHSRDLLFVALCRTFGIPSRLEPATKTPQYYFTGMWNDVLFEKKDKGPSKVRLVLNNDPSNKPKPEYYIHFTLEQYKDGFYRSLDYETDPVMQQFPAAVDISPGPYLLVTGKRITGGTVLAGLTFFNLQKNQANEVNIKLRTDSVAKTSYGKTGDPKKFLLQLSPDLVKCELSKGVVIAFIQPENEPSRHFIADLIQKQAAFNSWKGPVILFLKDQKEKAALIAKNQRLLPSTVIYAIPSPNALVKISEITKKKSESDLPLVLLMNPLGELTYYSEGYHIGIGGDIINLVSKK